MTTLMDYAAKVKEMREAQKKYFRASKEKGWNERVEALEICKLLEHELDALTSGILEGKESNNQMEIVMKKRILISSNSLFVRLNDIFIRSTFVLISLKDGFLYMGEVRVLEAEGNPKNFEAHIDASSFDRLKKVLGVLQDQPITLRFDDFNNCIYLDDAML